MGTQAKIYIHQENNMYSITDVYHDGYLSYIGLNLYKSFSSASAARKLGSYQELYGIDNGKYNCDDEPSIEVVWNDTFLNDYDFIYIYVFGDDGKWRVRVKNKLVLLYDQLIANNIIIDNTIHTKTTSDIFIEDVTSILSEKISNIDKEKKIHLLIKN